MCFFGSCLAGIISCCSFGCYLLRCYLSRWYSWEYSLECARLKLSNNLAKHAFDLRIMVSRLTSWTNWFISISFWGWILSPESNLRTFCQSFYEPNFSSTRSCQHDSPSDDTRDTVWHELNLVFLGSYADCIGKGHELVSHRVLSQLWHLSHYCSFWLCTFFPTRYAISWPIAR